GRAVDVVGGGVGGVGVALAGFGDDLRIFGAAACLRTGRVKRRRQRVGGASDKAIALGKFFRQSVGLHSDLLSPNEAQSVPLRLNACRPTRTASLPAASAAASCH